MKKSNYLWVAIGILILVSLFLSFSYYQLSTKNFELREKGLQVCIGLTGGFLQEELLELNASRNCLVDKDCVEATILSPSCVNKSIDLELTDKKDAFYYLACSKTAVTEQMDKEIAKVKQEFKGCECREALCSSIK